MNIDFSKIGKQHEVDHLLSPRDIFTVLPSKAPRYDYPRDVQTEVWKQWFSQRDQKDLVLKMNTGSGKTVVGLLILKSCLNEQKGPAVYVTPDAYLTRQVTREAADLGIEVTEDPTSLRFRRGNAILIVNVYKLFNGKSVFGVGGEGTKIHIGSLVVDDAHACLTTVEEQFTLTIEGTTAVYEELLNLFYDDLHEQSESGAVAIRAGDYSKDMLVPYWSWNTKLTRVSQILQKAQQTDRSIAFTYPLIRNQLYLCQAVFGGSKLELATRCLPIDAIPAFDRAPRRIFMTATLADDSVLVSHFATDPQLVKQAVTPFSANDIGERMILVPQSLNPELKDEDLKTFLKRMSEKHNVVVIVPSNHRASFWGDVADDILTKDSLHAGVQKLRGGHVGLVVLVNRYDGVDLPDDACRILVIDGLPTVRRKLDKLDQGALHGTGAFLSRQIQRIEQGMGRGIRSNNDYCAVILMGHSLTDQLYQQRAAAYLTPATRTQLEVSEQLSGQVDVHGKGVDELESLLNFILERNSGWVSASRGALVHTTYQVLDAVDTTAVQQRRAYDAARVRDFSGAVKAIEQIVNQAQDNTVRGWLKQQLAEYMHFENPIQSQEILKSANFDKYTLLLSRQGMEYSKLFTPNMEQAKMVVEKLKIFAAPNEYALAFYSVLDRLTFQPDTSDLFEAAVADLASFLGFTSQRPDRDYQRGPDVLWGIGGLKYFVIECKNGVTSSTISKHDAGQLASAMHWFIQSYDQTSVATPLLIHPTHIVNYHGVAHPETRVITIEKLSDLKSSLYNFITSITKSTNFDDKGVMKLLMAQNLTADRFLDKFTVQAVQSSSR